MRIESITKDNLEKENDNELFNLRMRFTQLFKKFYKTNLFKKSDFNFLERKDFLERYKLLSGEIKSRKLKVNKSSELDKVIFSKDMVGVDVKSLPDIPVMSDYISITGSFLKSPKSIGSFSIYIKDTADKRLVEVEERVRQVLEEELGKSPAIMKYEEDPPEDCLSLFDLVLKPKERLEKIKHEKTSNGYWKKTSPSKTEKINKEEVLEDYEYLIHHVEINNGEEEIHHCFLYDHLGNLFEQNHILIKNGKAYIDNKEIKDGIFHIIAGLESTQEVVWSDEEAKKADIIPKKMKAGMTLKQKSKEW